MNANIPPEMLTELQRQDEHLKRLPTDFEYPLFVHSTEMDDENATIDFNHPLAGKDLNFELELVEVVS